MTHVIILAGGKGTRMELECPKVLAEVGGRPIIERILAAVIPICKKPTLIVGFGGDEVIGRTGGEYHYVWQADQLGTGHAVLQAKPYLLNEPITTIVILPGDHPLVTTETIQRLVLAHEQAGTVVTMATVTVPNYDGENKIFYGYGRILRREDGSVRAIRELKDADEVERKVREVNCGYYCFKPAWLWEHIGGLDNKNKAREFYLTDMIGIAAAEGERVGAVQLGTTIEGMGVNTMEELTIAERAGAC